MKWTHIVCYYDEIALKRGNRRTYENLLIRNIERALSANSLNAISRTTKLYGRIILELKPNYSVDTVEKLRQCLSRVFGIAYFAFATQVKQDINEMNETCLSMLEDSNAESFRVTARRSDKKFQMTSQQINEQVGAHLFTTTQTKVSLSNPDFTCHIDVVDGKVLVYSDKIAGVRGLPVGSGGNMLVSLSGGFDSPVAAYMIMKRGAHIEVVHFHVYPYTTQESIEKVRELCGVLSKYQTKIRMHLVPFGDVQTKITLECPEKLRVILYRRMMLRISERIAGNINAQAIVTGEALGQVASQTIENITATSESVTLPILRPLIGFDKIEIMDTAKKIGTYEISSRPHDDCCVRFIPNNPATKAKIREVIESEATLNIEELISEAVSKTTVETIQ
jgi:thiamine biosynthesis protein ThiI